jgi:hypothetical protein
MSVYIELEKKDFDELNDVLLELMTIAKDTAPKAYARLKVSVDKITAHVQKGRHGASVVSEITTVLDLLGGDEQG